MKIEKLLMPWLFSRRKQDWTPFAKVRREGAAPAARRPARRRVSASCARPRLDGWPTWT